MNDIPLTFAVVTRVPSAEAGDGGNMAVAHGLAQAVPGAKLLQVQPVPVNIAINLRTPVFHLGEILILCPDGREAGGLGRCPSKWDVDTEEFDDIYAAVHEARHILFNEPMAHGSRTVQAIQEEQKTRDDKRAPLEAAEVAGRDVAKRIAASLPKGWGFCLVQFSFGEGGFMTYVSDVERDDVAKALRELLDKWERGDPDV